MSKNSEAPLSGLTVLDMTQFLSGPYCTQILADLGATVIKVESPQGDLSRTIPPHFVGDDSVYYLSINRNKRSVVADMKVPQGLELVRRLVLAADVIVENFRPGVLDRMGLRCTELREQKPSLVWCSISGFGQDGPYRAKPAYDMIVQALSGGMSLTGEPGRTAVRAGVPIGDISAGLYASTAILAALHRRTLTGRGDAIDISMLDCQAAMLSYQGAYYLHSGHVPSRQGTGHDSIPTYRSFRGGDGTEVVVTANTERMWQSLCRVLDLEELTRHPLFASSGERFQNRMELWPLLEQAFLKRDADDWVRLLEAEGIPVGTVNTLDRVMDDAQIQHRGMVMNLTAEDGREADVMGNPIFFDEAGRPRASFPPTLGQDTEETLRTVLGISAEEFAELVRVGAVMSAEHVKKEARSKALKSSEPALSSDPISRSSGT
jgi:CoA:oxalate CoA-transferase